MLLLAQYFMLYIILYFLEQLNPGLAAKPKLSPFSTTSHSPLLFHLSSFRVFRGSNLSAYSAPLRLCVKTSSRSTRLPFFTLTLTLTLTFTLTSSLYTFYMFYTAKGASGARLGARPNRRLRHPASRNAPGCFAKVSRTVGSWRRFGFRTSNNKLRLACHASASITGCVQYASYACEPRPLLL